MLSDVFGVYEYIWAKEVGQGSHEGPTRVGARPGGRRASLPRGLLVHFMTSTPSHLDHACSKNHAPDGFILFDILFLRNTEIGKKTAICTGPWVSRLVPKII